MTELIVEDLLRILRAKVIRSVLSLTRGCLYSAEAASWGDVSWFGRKEDFASFLGIVPSDYSSGDREHRGHITKQGNRSVRRWLVESSWVAIRHDPILLDKFRWVLRNCGSKKKAIVWVARKLALRLCRVLLSGEPYVVGVVE